jgi:hypothetical protein
MSYAGAPGLVPWPLILATVAPLTLASALHAQPDAAVVSQIAITTDTRAVGMGRCVTVRARATDEAGQPAIGAMLYPFVNQKRWGAYELTDAAGEATFHIPLPRVGEARIEVAALAGVLDPREEWIWEEAVDPGQPRYFQKVFSLPGKPLGGEVWVAAVDVADAYVNGYKVPRKIFWTSCQPTAIPAEALHPGDNVISVEGRAGAGWAGLVVYARFETEVGPVEVFTSPEWRVWNPAPEGWPETPATGGAPVIAKGRVDQSTALPIPAPWPTLAREGLRFAGSAPMGNLVWSNAEAVEVTRRELVVPARREGQHIVAQYENWFTPFNAWWTTSPAVPLVGLYDSRDPDVARQHLIWLIESGVDVVSGDWSNHIWFSKRWEDITPGSWEIIQATQVFLEEMARMKDEGYPVPTFTLLSGISHVRPEGPDAVNGQLKWIWDNLVQNPRCGPLWEQMDGKPLITLLNLGATYIKEGLDTRLDPRFTIRYVSAGNDTGDDETLGLWTWMDHKLPVPTVVNGRTEALTASVGCFGGGGWKAPDARGRRNGATLVEDWRVGMDARPLYLYLHQFQEFLGAPEGQGHGANKDLYYDTYSAELSDDIEPVSLTAPGYRGEGGWGYFYLNLTRALVDLYRQPEPQTTVAVISSPVRKQVVSGPELKISWVWVGKPPAGLDVYANGRLLAEDLQGGEVVVSLADVPDGPVELRLVARGTSARYRLEYERDEEPLAELEPAECAVHITKQTTQQPAAAPQ